MIDTLCEKIHDNRFLRLLRNMLAAGYLEDWVFNTTPSGVPQGGVVSPILSNIYLHRCKHSLGIRRRYASWRSVSADDGASCRGRRVGPGVMGVGVVGSGGACARGDVS